LRYMDEPTTTPVQEASASIKKKLPIYALIVALLVTAALAAAALWHYHPYFKEQRAVQEGEERQAILNSLPENPAAKDLTFEEREAILSGLEIAE